MLDSLFDDFPLHPSLRIPPLQDPLPDLSIQAVRPSPLEPDARLTGSIENETAKLTGRRKALAEAKHIGDPAGSDELRSIQRNPRKRQKLHEHERIADFVQLPQPKAKAKDDKPPPFQPVSVLNQLHEPPPSAALFPPITPSYNSSEQTRRLSSLSLVRTSSLDEDSEKSRKRQDSHVEKSPPLKRISQRPRMKWTSKETEQLMRGIEIYGVGKWKKILRHPDFSFQAGRTSVDLKDHFRTKSKSASLELSCDRKKVLPKTANSSKQGHDQTPSKLGQGKFSSPAKDQEPETGLSLKPKIDSQARGPWSKAEDASLEEGYKKHGLSWALILDDPELDLAHRSATEIEDRFRTNFPILFDPETDAPNNNHGTSIQRRGGWTRAEDLDLVKGYQRYGFSWTNIVKDPDLNLTHKTGPQARDRFRIKFPAIYEQNPPESIRDKKLEVKRQKERERREHTVRIGKPKETKDRHQHEGNPDVTERADDVAEDVAKGHMEPPSQRERDEYLGKKDDQVNSNKPSISTTGAYNIMGLLNSDVEDDRPPSPLRLDEWDENVTLPPLLWEEMATRPMFDLE